MPNDGAMNFVRNLFGACPNYKATREQKEDAARLYVRKLDRWRLTRDQWDAALDRLIDQNKEGDLPSLKAIYDELVAVQQTAQVNTDMGWCLFTVGEHRECIRIKNVNGKWLESESRRVPHHDYPYGKLTYTGNYIPMVLPEAAINIRFCPDAQAPEYEDVTERRSFVKGQLEPIGTLIPMPRKGD